MREKFHNLTQRIMSGLWAAFWVFAVWIFVGQISVGDRSLESRYHSAVNSPHFLSACRKAAQPLVWAKNRAADYIAGTKAYQKAEAWFENPQEEALDEIEERAR